MPTTQVSKATDVDKFAGTIPQNFFLKTTIQPFSSQLSQVLYCKQMHRQQVALIGADRFRQFELGYNCLEAVFYQAASAISLQSKAVTTTTCNRLSNVKKLQNLVIMWLPSYFI